MPKEATKPWPPFDGFISIEKTNMTPNEVGFFDRFQTPYKGNSSEELRGGFSSPIFESQYKGTEIPLPFTYESRALLTGVEENLVYIHFKFNPQADVTFSSGKAMPWAGTKGGAIQYQSSKNFDRFREGDYQIFEKLIFKKGKWREVPEVFGKYGKKIDDILKKVCE